MSYATIAHFAETWGLVWLALMFAGAVAYALWPANRTQFDHASRLPLEEDTDVRA